jgi:hypothetical protein
VTTKKQQSNEPEIFEPTPDPAGRVRLDRPLTPTEAAAQDAENLEQLVENRRKRFHTEGRNS